MDFTTLLTQLRSMMQSLYEPLAAKLQNVFTELNELNQEVDDLKKRNKRSVGLSLVRNYPPSTKTQAENGVNNATYMTPRRSKESIDSQVIVPLITIIDEASETFDP